MNLAEIAHVDVMHALLIVHRHLAVVRRVADEIRVFDQVAAAIIEMNCECGELPTPGFSHCPKEADFGGVQLDTWHDAARSLLT